jgi:hypothetical protein
VDDVWDTARSQMGRDKTRARRGRDTHFMATNSTHPGRWR